MRLCVIRYVSVLQLQGGLPEVFVIEEPAYIHRVLEGKFRHDLARAPDHRVPSPRDLHVVDGLERGDMLVDDEVPVLASFMPGLRS